MPAVQGSNIMRHAFALIAAVALSALSGCAMCESCLDHLYPACGGCCCHHADDCCRAGSAFCHDGGYGPLPAGEAIHGPRTQTPELADPVPELPSQPSTGNGWRERPQLPPSDPPLMLPETPSVDPFDVPDADPFPQTDAPQLPSLLPQQ
jgi:hypothetical protein